MNRKSYLIELGATDLCNSQRVRGYGYGHDYGYGFRKGRGSRDQIANICWTCDTNIIGILKFSVQDRTKNM